MSHNRRAIASVYNKAVSNTALSLYHASNTFGFTQAQMDNAEEAHLTCHSGAIRYKYDGGVPTTGEGHQLFAGDWFVLEGDDARRLQVIRDGSTDAVASITLSK